MRKFKYIVVLKSGYSFELEADDLEVEMDDDDGTILSYTFKNPFGWKPIGLSPLSIDTILESSGGSQSSQT
jgi:hypothetical protein